MSLSGTTNTYNQPTLDGLTIINADEIYINGVPIDTNGLVPYTGATSDVNLGTFNFQTLGSVSAKQHVFPSFASTLMTGPATSSFFTADAWRFTNSISTVSLGPVVSTSYLTLKDITNNSTIVTFQSDGIANFGSTVVRTNHMASNVYDVVNLSTLQASVAFIENVNALNYVPYENALQDLNMSGSTIMSNQFQLNSGDVGKVVVTNGTKYLSTTIDANYITGLTSQAGGVGQANTWLNTNDFHALRITSTIATQDYSLSVNAFNQLEFTNLTTSQTLKTNGASVFLPTGGNLYCSEIVYSNDLQLSGTSYFAYGSGQQWGTTLNSSAEYEVQDNAGVMRMRLSKSSGLTISTLNITQVPSATPTLALGVNGSGGVVSFAVPSGGNLLPLNNTWTGSYNQFNGLVSTMGSNRFIQPYNALSSDVSTLVNRATMDSAITAAVPPNLLPLSNVWTGALNNFNLDVTVGGSLGVLFNIVKQTISPLSYALISGGNASNSPSLQFFNGGSSRGYIGNATATDLDIVSQNGAQMNFWTAGAKRMFINTAGAVYVNNEFRRVGGNSGANWFSIRGEDLNNSPYLEFWVANTRRCYIGFATTTTMEIQAESGAKLILGAGGTRIMTIDPNGCVGIGTQSPTFKLHVAGADGNIRAEGAIYCDNYLSANPARSIVLNDANAVNWIMNNTGPKPISFGPGTWANGGYTVITQSQSANGPGLGLGASANGSIARTVIIGLSPGVAWGELILSSGHIYTSCFGTINNYTNGGGWVFVSDKRVKKDIKDIKTARSLQRIMALKPKTYKKIYAENSDTPVPQEVRDADHIGFLAQDVMETNPHCVSEWVDDNCVCDGDDGKRLGIAYGDINIHMVGAIQEIVKQSTSQATLVQELKKQNDAQQKEIDLLRQQGQEAQRAYDDLKKLVSDQNKLLELLMAKLK